MKAIPRSIASPTFLSSGGGVEEGGAGERGAADAVTGRDLAIGVAVDPFVGPGAVILAFEEPLDRDGDQLGGGGGPR